LEDDSSVITTKELLLIRESSGERGIGCSESSLVNDEGSSRVTPSSVFLCLEEVLFLCLDFDFECFSASFPSLFGLLGSLDDFELLGLLTSLELLELFELDTTLEVEAALISLESFARCLDEVGDAKAPEDSLEANSDPEDGVEVTE